MNVQIINKTTKQIVATYTLMLGGQNYVPAEKEYHDEAWRCAVNDGEVKDTERANYDFRLVKP